MQQVVKFGRTFVKRVQPAVTTLVKNLEKDNLDNVKDAETMELTHLNNIVSLSKSRDKKILIISAVNEKTTKIFNLSLFIYQTGVLTGWICA